MELDLEDLELVFLFVIFLLGVMRGKEGFWIYFFYYAPIKMVFRSFLSVFILLVEII
jgi:hypothetical protein